MALTELQVRNAKPRDKAYKLADGSQMYLLVHPKGGRYWQLAYSKDNKRKTASLGVYPAVGLKEARERRDQFKRGLITGEAPAERENRHTFGDVISDWMTRKLRPESAPATITKTEWLLGFVQPLLDREITSIEATDVLEILRRVEAQGRHESARRLRSVCSRIFRFAIATGKAKRDVCADLMGALTAPKVKHRAAPLSPADIGRLVRATSSYQGYPIVGAALRLGILTFTRPYELRWARWEEFDLDNATWRIPAVRMKMKRDHIVPLSRQSVAVLTALRKCYVPIGLVFPSLRSDARPISENTINAALRNLGFSKEEATHHGFRRMASTTLNERGWSPDWIEKQLAHIDQNKIRRAYNAAEYLDGRREMMQAWADLLDDFEIADMIG